MATTWKSEAAIAGFAPDAPDGNVKARMGTITYDADDMAPVAGDTIQMVPVPKGAQIIDIKLMCTACTPTSAGIGDGDSTSRYFSALGINTALITDLAEAGVVTSLFHEYTAADTIDILLNTGDLASGDTITIVVLYKVEGGIADET